MPQEFQPTQSLAVTLEAQEWNIVLAGLGELPLKYSGTISTKLRQQLMEMLPSSDAVVVTNNGKDREAQSHT